MFDIMFGLRAQSKSQLVLMIFGFSLFGAMVTFCLALGPKLFQSQPQWVQEKEATFVTVGIQGQDNELGNTSLNRLEPFKTMAGVIEMATLGVQQGVNTRLLEQERKVKAALFSDNFAQTLKAEGFNPQKEQLATSVYLSHTFWQNELQGALSIVGQGLYLTDADLQLQVAGILPAEYDELMPDKPEIWMVNSLAASILNVSFAGASPPESFIKSIKAQIADENTIHIGLLKLTKGTTEKALINQYLATAQVDTEEDEDTQLHSSNRFSDLKIVSGINLMPNAKAQLQFQWWLILALSLALGIVVSLNFLSSSIAQLISRQQELNVRVAVGASQLQLLKTLLLEQLFLWLLSAIGVAAITQLGFSLLVAYQYPLAQITTNFLFINWMVTVVFLACLVALIVFYSLWHVSQTVTFSRGKAGQHSKTQERLAAVTITFQLILAGLAICFGSALTIEQSQKFKNLPFNQKAVETKVGFKAQNNSIETIDLSQLKQRLPKGVAFSHSPFVLPEALSMQFDTPQGSTVRKVGVNLVEVSDNYFTYLASPMLKGNGFDGHSLIVNEAAAKLLQPKSPLALVGARLYTEQTSLLGLKTKEPITVSAIVTNLPHYGVLNANIPMVYVNTIQVTNNNLAKLYLLFDEDQRQAIDSALTTWASQQGGLDKMMAQSIQQKLEAENEMMRQLVFLGLLFAGLICLLSAFSLYQQLRAHLKLEHSHYGVLLAVGAQPSSIALLIWRDLGILLGVATIPIAIVLVWVQPFAFEQFQMNLLNTQALGLSVLALVAICLMSSLRPYLSIMRQPIADLLRIAD